MNDETDLSKHFPAAFRRMMARKTGVIGGVTVSEADVDHLDHLEYLATSRAGVSNLWVLTLSGSLVKRPEFEGLRGFAETFGDGHFWLYALSDDFYNVTFVCEAGTHAECRGTHEPLSSEAFSVPPEMEDDDDDDAKEVEALIDRQIEALWPEHLETIVAAFWVFLRSPFDYLSSVASPDALVWETNEVRIDREAREAADALTFFQSSDRTRQALRQTRPQVR